MKLLAAALVVAALLLIAPIVTYLMISSSTTGLPLQGGDGTAQSTSGGATAPGTALVHNEYNRVLVIENLPSIPKIQLQENDVICEIGNGLADRMQHDGWVETLIQSRSFDKKLVFRNLAFTGDTVAVRPRQEGFMPPEDYLKLCKADVIFAYFGYNESFAGEKGLAKFKSELGAMIDKYREIGRAHV